MKQRIHIVVENETIDELELIHKKTRVAKSVILDMIIQDGFEKLRQLNYNFSEFMKDKV